jgi:GT2 family glycosyltransferase
MVIRKAAYEQLLALGFENLLTGGIGTKRSAGEDTELCLAVRLLGYRIVYDPLLHFVHFMPVRRLQWKTLVAIARANGQASVCYSPYRYHFARRQGHRYPVHTHWQRELLANLTFLLNGRTWLRYFFGKNEGNPAVIRIERQLAKLKALLQLRRHYDESFHRIGKLVADAPLAAPRGT